MAVNVAFNGPLTVHAGTQVARITGLEKSRFTIQLTFTTTATSGRTNFRFNVHYRKGEAEHIEQSVTESIHSWNNNEITLQVAYDCRDYDECTITIVAGPQLGGVTTVTDVHLENYKSYSPPDMPEPRKNVISFNIERLVPRFILADKNGYALAKAIERAFQIVAEATQRGIEIIQDPRKMPEWRLDELAGELGCLYDYNGTLEQKRYWIINATYLYSIYGTPQAIYNFLEGYFQIVQVQEFWEYDGDPYHFQVTVSGSDYSAEKIAWAQKAILNVKNVRSVLDSVVIDNSSDILVSAETDYFYASYFYDPDEITTGDGIEEWIDQLPLNVARTDEARTDEGMVG